MIIGVLVQLANQSTDKIFDYLVPAHLQSSIQIGIRVQVPFGHQVLEGFVLKIGSSFSKPEELKEILAVVDDEVVLNEELLTLGKWIAKETLSTLICCYQVMLPKALKAKNGVVVKKRYDHFIQLVWDEEQLRSRKWNPSCRAILAYLKEHKVVLKEELNKISVSSVKTLLKQGVLADQMTEKYRFSHEIHPEKKYPLTLDQQKVVDRVSSEFSSDTTFLLYGVTGSGKTEVYMELIEMAMQEGKSSLMLVPEISLTPQMIDRFESRFGDRVAVLHSGLSDGEKYDEWRRIARGEVQIVIGARSAVFAPFAKIGMIIVDEEHSSTYKQENNPKYDAIEVALQRSRFHHCPVVLGSATPSLESFARAQRGVYRLLQLPHRVNQKPLPLVTVVDMNAEVKKGKGMFSSLLLQEIQTRLDRKEQVLLLLNRRGYASFISCAACGYVEKCPHCDITLTYHKSSNLLRCHYCGYTAKKSEVCPSCHETSIKDLGMGTERVEEQLRTLFPGSRILRMDVDTTSKKGAHKKMIRAFQNQEYDVLLGTQMIAKGLDFANVTLVGVINADTSLNMPDFRSGEETFQLLSQVSGRSGRKEKEGTVILQTFNPEHYVILCAQHHDYLGFYQTEMNLRRQLKYPPYYYLTYVRILSADYEVAKTIAQQMGTILKQQLKHSIVLGPSVCSVFRVNNIYRFGIIIKYKKEDQLYPVLRKLKEHYQPHRKVVIDVDFNPRRL